MRVFWADTLSGVFLAGAFDLGDSFNFRRTLFKQTVQLFNMRRSLNRHMRLALSITQAEDA